MTTDADLPVVAVPVVAVVVTYRRPRLATRVVRSLIEVEGFAPDRVVLVVNGEGGLDDPELEAAIQVVRLPNNLGPAGGFREGMLAAGDTDARWFLLCEDDIALFDLPSPRVARLVAEVEALEEREGRGPVGAVVAYGRDLHRRSGHTTPHLVEERAIGYDAVDAACWGSSLVSRRVLDKGIVPNDDYFFGYEDFDFFYQLSAAGFRLLVDRASAARTQATASPAGRDEAFTGERPVDADEPWRAFYIARNYFTLSRRHGSWTWIVAHLWYSVRRLQLARSRRERAAILHGLWEGARGRLGKDPRYLREVGELGADEAPVRRVLHVLPNDIARGGQVIARDLRDSLDGKWGEHRILIMFDSEPAVLKANYTLGLRMGRLRNLGFDPRGSYRLWRAIRRLRPTVVVAHGGEPLKYLAFVPRGDLPLVYFAFGIVTEKVHRQPSRGFYRFLMHRADVVAGISHETVDEARDIFGVPEDRLALLPNSRDPEVYRGDPSPAEAVSSGADAMSSGSGDAESVVTLAFVGHLTATKRPLWFIEVVAELRRRGHRVRGVMAGDGPLEEEVLAAAPAAGVEVLGRRSDIPEILAGSDIFLFTSVPESEGMPGVLIEAGLSGLPVVSTAAPGSSTVLEEGVSGYIVPVEDLPAMVDAAERLVADGDLRDRMGAAARRRCVELFSLDASATRWTGLFESLTAGQRPGAGQSDGAASVTP